MTGVRFPSPALSGARSDPLASRLRAAGCVFAEEEAELLVAEAAGELRRLETMVRRREAGEPLEYVVGWAELCGVRVEVEPGVFVPRDRSEQLVAEALEAVRSFEAAAGTARPVVVDLCCGAGAVGAAIASAVGEIELHASDIDAAAVELARRNLARFGGSVHRGDLLAALPDSLRGRVCVIASNAPYVPSGELGLMPREARLYEPPWALDGGADGMGPLRRIVAEAPDWLAPGGSVAIEAAADTVEVAVEEAREAGLTARAAVSEELDVAVVVGSR